MGVDFPVEQGLPVSLLKVEPMSGQKRLLGSDDDKFVRDKPRLILDRAGCELSRVKVEDTERD